MTRLCVAIFVRDEANARRDIALAAEAGVDMVELRVDTATDEVQLYPLIRDSILPCIVTCRPTWEGGQCELPDESRVGFLKSTITEDARYIDVELATLKMGYPVRTATAAWRTKPPPELIVSAHDFQGRPARLTAIVQELWEGPGDVAKIVWTARTIRDNLEAFEILRHRAKPTIALCMGEHGLISRILAKKFGAFLTFASLGADSGTAPGQISIADMKGVYRWDAIGKETKVYGVLGSPVMHSMSPAIHNAAFEAVGHDGVYLPLLVHEGYESFKAFMEVFLAFEPLHFSGVSVTLPHKENALRYLVEKGAEVEELALRIGAVNTIVVERVQGSGFGVQGGEEAGAGSQEAGEGGQGDKGTRGQGELGSSLNPEPRTLNPRFRLRGFNTDYAAILDSITSKMGIRREQLGEYRVAVIGAGGTGRTAVAALAHYGATVVVYNRTMERAEALAKEFNGRTGKVVAARMEKLCDSCCHVFINCTSMGMWPKVDESPVGDQVLKFGAETVVFDTIYNPMKTRFLREAEGAGAKVISGVEMFVRQAVGQFEGWTGEIAPVEVMRGVVEMRLLQIGKGHS